LRLTRYLKPDRVLLINLIPEAVAACLADLPIRLIWRCGLWLPSQTRAGSSCATTRSGEALIASLPQSESSPRSSVTWRRASLQQLRYGNAAT
jgi:hypothetical protein